MTTISNASNATLEIGTATVTGAANIASLTAIGSDTMRVVPQMTRVDVPQASNSSSKEVTLDGVNVTNGGIAKWSDLDGEFLTAYITATQGTHNDLIADAAVSGGRFRNFRCVEPDAGNKTTVFIGHVTECKGGPYEAAEEGKARRHNLKVVVYGTPTVTL